MSIYEMLMLFWLLPSLITFFLWIQIEKMEVNSYRSKLPADFDKGYWTVMFILSITYPVGLLFVIIFIIDNYSSFLTKELW